MEEDFYGDGSLAQFESNRSRLMRSTQGITENNRKARLKSFERAMKAQFGPNVIVSPDGIATRRGKEVGNLDAFMKAGGKLQGTPKDPRSQLEIRQQENEKLAENYTPPTFEQTMEGMFPKAKDRLSFKTFESTDGGVNLDEMSQYTDTGEQDSGDYTDLEKLVSSGSDKSGTSGSSTRDQLKTNAVGPAGISDRNVPKGYIRTEGKLQSIKSVKGQRAKLRLDRLRKLQARIKAGK